MTITVFKARRIITMDDNQPFATHVAVRDGRILAVGDEQTASQWGYDQLDEQFADAVLMPGFVEGHAHLMAGAIWRYTYVGYHDRQDPEGKIWSGSTTIEAVIQRLQAAERALPDAETPLIAWGIDPIFLTTERLNRQHLDQVSTTRPVAVLHSNFHLMTVNSPALTLVNYTRDTPLEGVVKDASGEPNGELQEMACMFPLQQRIGFRFSEMASGEEALRSYAAVCRLVGVTTATDLFAGLQDAEVENLLAVTAQEDFPLRLVPALNGLSMEPAAVAERALQLRARSTDKLRLGIVKLMTDGSIQGYTARLKWPGYITGAANGMWNTAPDQLQQLCETLHAQGVQMHIHTNGDEASDVTIDALERALAKHPRGDHRHTLQHGQLIDAAQFRRMRQLGLCSNLFANHLYYFGDQHARLTVGESRAQRMNACRSALDHGVPLAIHSDAPVTPMGPLTTAWCAVNRRTGSGRTLGEAQKISVGEALFAITLGAAYTLKLDGEIGSIEVGKKADFAVLGEDPLAVAAEALNQVPVLGTVSGGRVFLS